MDTATHFAMGAALAGLATVDPAVTAHYPAIVTALVAGSQIPDIDTVLKLRNNAVYITNHRGITHSIPFTLMWPVVIVALIFLVIPDINVLHFWLWTQLAVFLHVFVDIFNSYGTQALRPFNYKWIQIGIINTFDPIMFALLVTGSILWAFGVSPVPVFLSITVILVIYYIIRRLLQQSIRKHALSILPQDERIIKTFVAPTIRFFEWRVAVETDRYYYIGRSYKLNVHFSDRFKRTPLPPEEVMQHARKDPNLKAFLSFSSIYRWTLVDRPHGYELRFIDLRYLKNGHYSFVAILNLDPAYQVTHSYTGWVVSEDKLIKILHNHPVKP
ncbi:metal-dependent hydrolase [Macrococcus bovicus]|uniref:Metal-dependent hydrolase n=1 Tax=Macrococcus bovicus TaxID=69968 RepID=A0A4R6BZE1_9STAP|nr:metal-dependent hydrolase [Macrococcus bovicus]TDM13925.1 metal-dependent hydrolase [Macrococcus bovicus]